MPLDVGRVRQAFPGRRIEWRQTTQSTMPDAVRMIEEGCESGSVAGADGQTEGQGRHGHGWHSEAEAGLYLSIVLRLPGAPPVVTLALGLAAVEAIHAAARLVCDLRWPNDLLLDELKCGGILVQVHEGALVAGIGINVNQVSFPPDLTSATSMRLVSGQSHSRERLLIELLGAVDRHIALLQREGAEPVLRLFGQASSYVRGRRVTVDQDETRLSGITEGLTPSGFLLLREDSGRRTVILAGGVRPAGR